MKNIQFIYFGIFLLSFFPKINGQDAEFRVAVSSDTVLLGNYFEVKFTVLNTDGKFTPPNFSGLKIIAGPNKASSYSMINGEVSQSSSYIYYLKPDTEGEYLIDEAIINTSDGELHSPKIKIVVMPNPNGIKQNPRSFDEDEALPLINPIPANKKKSKPTYKI
jgi:hypothetical protein